MEFKDYYQTLGVAKDASQDDIKRAYRKLARKYHPDVSEEEDAEQRFQEVSEAYEVLKDPEKRAAYDQLGSRYHSGEDFRPPPDWDAGFEFSGGGFTGADAGAFSDFFEELFGARGQRSSHFHTHFGARGEDHHAKILIDLEDAFQGASRTITLQIPEVDDQGRVRTRDHSLRVSIPKGITPGQQIRLSGQGGRGMGRGEPGDLYLEVQFRPHPLYQVDGRDIHLTLPVAPWEAALGETVAVPTPGGKVDLKVPQGSSSGKRLRLKGRGLPGKTPGDLYVTLQVALPPADSDEAREIYRQMAEKLAFNPRANMGV